MHGYDRTQGFSCTVQELGSRLRKAREAAGLTQAQAGELVEVGRDSVRGYEDGTRTIPALYVAALARRTGYCAGWLLTGEGEEKASPPGQAEAILRFIRLVANGEIPPPTPPDTPLG